MSAPFPTRKSALIPQAEEAECLLDIDALMKVINQQECALQEKDGVIEKKSTVITEQK